MEENISRLYSSTNSTQETSEGSIQINKQQLYKFTTEFNPSDNLQTEYNILVKSAENTENTKLNSNVIRQGQTVSEKISELRIDKPFSINQEIKSYYTLNQDHIFHLRRSI